MVRPVKRIGTRTTAAIGIGIGVGYAALHHLGRTSGSTRAERAEHLPGDDLVGEPQVVTDHAITIDAPPADVWPWLVQMGWHRAGWYTARWVDLLLFPANEASADRVHPEWQDLEVGDRVLDGDPATECWFVVSEIEPNRHLVLHSTSHLPPEFRDRVGATIDWSWSFVLRDLGDGRSRFHFRTRARVAPMWLAAAYRAALVPADHVMARQMLSGVAARAEGRQLDVSPAGRPRVCDTLAGVALMAVTPAIRPLHLRWGASSEEVHAPMPGDDLLDGAHFVATRAITIDAPPEAVWPWLMQVGIGRGGFYSYDVLDNPGRSSSDEVLGEWQHLGVGDTVAPMVEHTNEDQAFRIAEIDEPTTVVWTKADSSWAWVLRPVEGGVGRTRLITRLKVRYQAAPSSADRGSDDRDR